MTCDRWGEVNLLSKFRLPSFYGLGMKVCLRYFHKESLTQLVDDKEVCWTAPATPGVFIIYRMQFFVCNHLEGVLEHLDFFFKY